MQVPKKKTASLAAFELWLMSRLVDEEGSAVALDLVDRFRDELELERWDKILAGAKKRLLDKEQS